MFFNFVINERFKAYKELNSKIYFKERTYLFFHSDEIEIGVDMPFGEDYKPDIIKYSELEAIEIKKARIDWSSSFLSILLGTLFVGLFGLITMKDENIIFRMKDRRKRKIKLQMNHQNVKEKIEALKMTLTQAPFNIAS